MMEKTSSISRFPATKAILHGADYNPDQWLHDPRTIEEDFRLMRISGCNTFTLGIFAWTQYEPAEDAFNFDWMDELMDRMGREGFNVILATPSGAKPAWMAKRYEEIRRVDRAGRREPFLSRHNHCWQSPVYRQKVRAINTRLAERYGAHPALIAWHVSNELEGDCYCPLCLKEWHRWLEERYHSIEALNKAWWTAFWNHTFSDWDEIHPTDYALDGMSVDWRRFNTRQICDFIEWEAEPLRKIAPHVPLTTNFMNLFPRTDYAQVSRHVDFVCDDQYPGYDTEEGDLLDRVMRTSFKNDLFRSFKGPGTPWMLMECATDWVQWAERYRFKRPGLHLCEMIQALGHGAQGTLYFQWRKGRGGFEKFHSAVVDHVGHENTRVFQTVADLSRSYQSLTQILGSEHDAKCAVIYDWEVQWGYESSSGTPSKNEDYLKTCLAHYRPLRQYGIGIDVITSRAAFEPYRVIVAPQLFMLLPGVAERLKVFVAKGGRLVLTYNSGICDQDNLCFTGGWPGDGLMDIAGVWNEEGEALAPGKTRRVRASALWPGTAKEGSGARFCAVIHSRGAEVLAAYADSFYEGLPCVTRNAYGSGEAYYLATGLDSVLLGEFYSALMQRCRLSPPLGVTPPEGVVMQTRTSGNRKFHFIQNFSETSQMLPLGEARLESLTADYVAHGKIEIQPWHADVYEEV